MVSRGINNNKEIPNCTRKRVYGSTHIAVNAKQRRGSSVRSCHLEGLLQNLPWIYGVTAVVLWASNTFRLCPTTRVASNGTLSRPGALTFGATNLAWLWCPLTHSSPGHGLYALGPAHVAMQTSFASVNEMGILATITSLYMHLFPADAVARSLHLA